MDALHCLDLGVLQYVIASALVELVQENVWPGTSREECFFAAHADYAAWCRTWGIPPAPRFVAKKFYPENDYPCLTQNMAKGAQTRWMQYWVLDVLKRPGGNTTLHGQMRLCMFTKLCRAEDIMLDSGRFLSAPGVQEVQAAVETALQCYNALALEAVTVNLYLWGMSPKFHMLTHLAYDMAAEANPRSTSCYADEDMVGRMKRLMSRCHGSTAGVMGVHRYIILVGVRWWKRLAELRHMKW